MTEETSPPEKKPFLHPASGGLILGADWLLFSGVVFSGGLGVPAAVVLGFFAGLIGVTCAQHFAAGQGWLKSFYKGVLAGIVVGLPFPIFGTLLGGGVLAISGLDQLRDRATKAVADSTKKRLTGSDEKNPQD